MSKPELTHQLFSSPKNCPTAHPFNLDCCLYFSFAYSQILNILCAISLLDSPLLPQLRQSSSLSCNPAGSNQLVSLPLVLHKTLQFILHGTDREIFLRQALANCFYKGPHSNYFRFCGSHLSQFLISATVVQKQPSTIYE